MANQYLTLALFLMMLSFFIVLNGMSSYDNKKKDLVVSSVKDAFSLEIKEPEIASLIDVNAVQSLHTGDSLERMRGLFGTHISNFRASKNRMGTVMKVTLPYDEFKTAIQKSVAVSPDTLGPDGDEQGSFLPTMISLVRSEKSGVPYRMDIVLNAPQHVAEDVNKVSLLTDMLEKAGLPEHLISAGLGEGPAEMVDLYFRRYEAYNPLNHNAESR